MLLLFKLGLVRHLARSGNCAVAAVALLLAASPAAAQSSEPSRTLVATYPGPIVQINDRYALISINNGYAIVDRTSGAVDPIPAQSSPIGEITLTPFGVLFWTRPVAIPGTLGADFFEWRTGAPGTLVPLGQIGGQIVYECFAGVPACPVFKAYPFRVVGNWALWRTPYPPAATIRRDLQLAANTTVSPSTSGPQFSAITENGDVFGLEVVGSTSNVVRWRNGAVTTLATNQPHGSNLSTDGALFAYAAVDGAGPNGEACNRSVLVTLAGATETLGTGYCATVAQPPPPAPVPRAGIDYDVRNGRVLFRQQAPLTLWTREPNGARHALEVAPWRILRTDFAPGGDFVYLVASPPDPSSCTPSACLYSPVGLYVGGSGEPPIDLGRVTLPPGPPAGEVPSFLWLDGAWRLLDGASLYRLNLPTIVPLVLAEGATGTFFETDVAILNPTATSASAQVSFLTENGSRLDQTRTIPAHSRLTIRVNDQPGVEATAASTRVEPANGAPLVVERTMTWDASGYGGHSGSSVEGPRIRWHFAEGAQGYFDTFFLLVNPSTVDTTVALTFLREGATSFEIQRAVPAGARVTVYAGAIPELANRSFATTVSAPIPIVAERAMYFGSTPFWTGGHESAGAPAASTRWFHAEGATGAAFDTFILLANITARPANVHVRFLTDTGVVVDRNYTMAASARLTVPVETVDPALAIASFATTVESDVPIVSERAMYWSLTGGAWDEAHNSFGVTSMATKWATSDGRAGGPRNYQTYVLVANPSTTQTANLTATFMREDGAQFSRTFTLSPNRRLTIACNDVPELAGTNFGVVVESTNAVPIAVERATYWDANGVTWAGGSNVTATPIP